MRATIRIASLAFAAITVVGGLAMAGPASAATGENVNACAASAPGFAHCTAIRHTPGGLRPNAASPTGLSPSDLRSAYGLTSSGSSSQTIAIVDAYNAPTAEADL